MVTQPATAACRQALALGLDVSGSVDAVEYRLQLDGLAAALDSAEVREVLLRQSAAAVRITVYEWSGPRDQLTILPWTEIDNDDVLSDVIAQLATHNRPQGMGLTTALGQALSHGLALLAPQDACWRRTLDISGDGQSNTGPRPQDITLAQPGPDVVVNALVIGTRSADATDGGGATQEVSALANSTETTDLAGYFASYVIRGAGAFVEEAQGFDAYEAAMRRKLLRELQSIAIGAIQTTGTRHR